MGKGNDYEAIDVDGPRALALREAISLSNLSASTPREPFTKARRRLFLEIVGTGATISEAARAAGVSTSYIYHLKRNDEAFAEAVALALQAGTDPLIGRAAAIGLHGDPGSMATVQAIKLVLQANHPAFRDSRAAGVSISRTHPDGTVDRLSASANGIPD